MRLCGSKGSMQPKALELVKAERERQAKAGIQEIEFDEAASNAFLKKAYDVAWDSVIAKAPESGKKLRALAGISKIIYGRAPDPHPASPNMNEAGRAKTL